MKNTLSDLNNFLFAELENLSDPDLVGDEIKDAIAKSEAVVNVAEAIIKNADTTIKAMNLMIDSGIRPKVKQFDFLEIEE